MKSSHSFLKITSLSLASLLAGGSLSAQTIFDPYLQSGSDLTLVYDGGFTGKTNFKHNGQVVGSATVSRSLFSVYSPQIATDDHTVVRAALTWGGDFPNPSKNAPIPAYLKEIVLRVFMNRKFNNAWEVKMEAAPGLHTAGSTFNSKGFGVDLTGAVTHALGDNASITAGLAYDSLAKGLGEAVPIIELDWQSSPGWHYRIGFPECMVKYAVSSDVSLSLETKGDYQAYYARGDLGGLPSGDPPLGRSIVEYSDYKVGARVDWRFGTHLACSCMVGENLAQTFGYHGRQFRVKASRSTPFISGGIVYTF